jgi:hypothetical protein
MESINASHAGGRAQDKSNAVHDGEYATLLVTLITSALVVMTVAPGEERHEVRCTWSVAQIVATTECPL